MIDLGEEALIEFYNNHTFEELIPILKGALEMGKLDDEGVLVSIWTAGWSNDEYLVGCLKDYRCKHHYNYVGDVFAVSYFAKDIDKKYDYIYRIVAEPMKRDNDE